MTYQATFRQSFPFQQYVKARYVKLEAISNFYGNFSLSGGDKVGLGEIAFQSNFDNLECAGSIGKQITDTDSPNEIFTSKDAWQVIQGVTCGPPSTGWITSVSGKCSNSLFNDNKAACLAAPGVLVGRAKH